MAFAFAAGSSRPAVLCRRHIAVLERDHGADQLQQGERERRLERKSRAFPLRFLAEVAMQRALEERGALRHPRHLVVDDQRGRALHPLDRFHRVGAEVGRAPRAAVALSAGLRAVDAPPVGQPLRLERVGPKRQVDRQRIVGGYRRERKALADVGILNGVAAAHRKACEHSEPLDIQRADCRQRGPSHRSPCGECIRRGNTRFRTRACRPWP